MSARALRLLALLALLALPLWHKARVESARALQAGEAHEARGDLRGAVSAYQRAARAYSPGSERAAAGAAALARLAAAAEARGDHEGARWALDHLRGAARATRWLLSPLAQEEERANAALTRLRARQEEEEAAARGEGARPRATREALHAAYLQADPRPHPAASLAVVASGLCWLWGLTGLLCHGVSPAGGLTPRAPRWAALTLLAGLGALTALACC